MLMKAEGCTSVVRLRVVPEQNSVPGQLYCIPDPPLPEICSQSATENKIAQNYRRPVLRTRIFKRMSPYLASGQEVPLASGEIEPDCQNGNAFSGQVD
jgi:hypothetical protein